MEILTYLSAVEGPVGSQDIAWPEDDTKLPGKGVKFIWWTKQRLAMSRAMILNPDILILDDLSAVDATQFAIDNS